MHLVEIWRYPVKSTAGEQLTASFLGSFGLPGDRVVHVQAEGRILTSRRHSRLLGLHSRLDASGVPTLEGWRWDGPEAAQLVRAAAGSGATLVASDDPGRFDVLPLLVATDGALAHWGGDPRRLRPNLVIGGVEGLGEFDWPGHAIGIGEAAVVGLHSRRARCVMTTFDPDTLEQDKGVLRDITRRYGGALALNAWVLQPGPIAVGMPVELLDLRSAVS